MRSPITSYTQPNILSSIINRAILANLQCRTLKLCRLIVLHGLLPMTGAHGYKNFRSKGNSLFPSPHHLDFDMLGIFSLKNVNLVLRAFPFDLTYLHARCIMHMKCCQQISKQKTKGGQKVFHYGEIRNPVCYHGNRVDKLVLKSTFSRILLQRIKHF